MTVVSRKSLGMGLGHGHGVVLVLLTSNRHIPEIIRKERAQVDMCPATLPSTPNFCARRQPLVEDVQDVFHFVL